MKGLDFVQVGMTSVGINARGFNSSFNNRMLMVEDGRVMVLPENGLPVGQFTATPKVDLAGIEVLVGPGAALYGADASSGVISMADQGPARLPGAHRGGDGRQPRYRDLQARYAGVQRADWGYKVSRRVPGGQRLEQPPHARRAAAPASTAQGDATAAGIMPEVGRGGAAGAELGRQRAARLRRPRALLRRRRSWSSAAAPA